MKTDIPTTQTNVEDFAKAILDLAAGHHQTYLEAGIMKTKEEVITHILDEMIRAMFQQTKENLAKSIFDMVDFGSKQ